MYNNALFETLLVVYAIFNLLLLLMGLGLTVSSAMPVIVVFTTSFLINKLTMEYMIDNLSLLLRRYDVPPETQHASLYTHFFNGTRILLSLFRIYTELAGHILVQVLMLSQHRLSLPTNMRRLYMRLFVSTGLLALLFNEMNETMPCLGLKDDDSRNQSRSESPRFYDRMINMYLTHSLVFPIGVTVGALFSAISDYQALFGLLCLATHLNLFNLSAVTINGLSSLYAVASISEDLSTLVAGFRDFALEGDDFSKSSELITDSNHYIPENSMLNRFADNCSDVLSFLHTVLSFLASTVAAACLFNGWQRIVGVTAVVSSISLSSAHSYLSGKNTDNDDSCNTEDLNSKFPLSL
ncbi:MAG: hypothetical protein CMF43_05695 [Legionellales bacterium]|nr:hypothetical protein [Legionellales bacterium]